MRAPWALFPLALIMHALAPFGPVPVRARMRHPGNERRVPPEARRWVVSARGGPITEATLSGNNGMSKETLGKHFVAQGPLSVGGSQKFI